MIADAESRTYKAVLVLTVWAVAMSQRKGAKGKVSSAKSLVSLPIEHQLAASIRVLELSLKKHHDGRTHLVANHFSQAWVADPTSVIAEFGCDDVKLSSDGSIRLLLGPALATVLWDTFLSPTATRTVDELPSMVRSPFTESSEALSAHSIQ